MNFDLEFITTNAIVVVPIVIALVQAIKLTGFIKDHFLPLIAIAVGIIIAFIGGHDAPNMSDILLNGVIYGLMASGLYSGVKTTMVAHARMEVKRKNERELKSK